MLLMIVCCNSRVCVRPSVLSIDSRIDVQVACCSTGAGSRYRSIAAASTQAHTVANVNAAIRGTRFYIDWFKKQ